MKKKLFSYLAVFVMLIFAIGACNKTKEEVKTLTTDEAKVEVRSASQEVNTNMDQVMNTAPIQSVNYLSTLLDNGTWKSTIKILIFQTRDLNLSKVKDAFRKDETGKSKANGIGDFGVYQYNFDINDFELIEASSTKLVIKYPASDIAFANRQNNAELVADNLTYTTVTYTDTYWDEYSQTWITDTYDETIPTNLNLSLTIDGVQQMSGNYSGTLSESGYPTSANVSISMPPYQFDMSLSGSGTNFNTSLSFKQSDVEMMGYSLDIVYSSDLEKVDKVTGYYHIRPLKIEGWANLNTIESYITETEGNGGNYDLDYLNSQISLELFQTVLNAKIGDLAFKLYTDEYNYTSPNLAVVYADGTYEWLSDIMNDDGTFKFVRKR